MAAESSLSYHEPCLFTILLQPSFLLVLNYLNSTLDNTVYCGLLGQVLMGTAFGTPGAGWLEVAVDEVVGQLGYPGLLLLVVEGKLRFTIPCLDTLNDSLGGLSTSFRSLKANIVLSMGIAIVGIAVPMGLSFALGRPMRATLLQAFAVDAAL